MKGIAGAKRKGKIARGNCNRNLRKVRRVCKEK